MELNIYLEGKSDILFLSLVIGNILNKELQFNKERNKCTINGDNCVVNLNTFDLKGDGGGVSEKSLLSLISHIKTVDLKLGIKSVIILDTDTPNHQDPKGGFIERDKYLKEKIDNENIPYFLIPNNKENGNLETLLENLVSSNGEPFFNCLKKYVNCLQSLENPIPPGISRIMDFRKTKIEWYIYMMLEKNSPQNKENNLTHLKKLWNLTHDDLLPLIEFLNKILPRV